MSKLIDFTDTLARTTSSTTREGRGDGRISAHDRLRRRLGQIDRLNVDQAAVIDGILSEFLGERPARRRVAGTSDQFGH
jgi:hypothetical protein